MTVDFVQRGNHGLGRLVLEGTTAHDLPNPNAEPDGDFTIVPNF